MAWEPRRVFVQRANLRPPVHGKGRDDKRGRVPSEKKSKAKLCVHFFERRKSTSKKTLVVVRTNKYYRKDDDGFGKRGSLCSQSRE